MKRIFLILFACFSLAAHSQSGVTFSVEELSKPEKFLFSTHYNNVWERLIVEDMQIPLHKVKNLSTPVGTIKKDIVVPFNIIARSNAPDSLIYEGSHSFFNGMFQAYAEHRPFVLSPDMIWLLISQGFARHVNANPEKMRPYFVDYSGKLSLIVPTDKVTLDNPQSPWEEIFPQFTEQIAKHIGKDLIQLLSADFSTTTPIEKVASEITIMEAMKPYFEFIVMRIVCGIPEITLKGTPEDWEKVLNKAKLLSRYDLEWWTKELVPLLEEFVNASRGKVNKDFWRNMFKYHTPEKYGAALIIDGWIVKFFPYDKKDKRNNLQQLEFGDNLPEEIVKVDLQYIEQYSDTTLITPLELWSGFIGIEQNKESFALTPVIGWMIRKKDITNNEAFKQKLKADNDSNWSGIAIRVKEVPSELFDMEQIKSLEIAFIGKIVIPEQLAKVKIEKLTLSGEIDEAEIKQIRAMFPDSKLIINKKSINATLP